MMPASISPTTHPSSATDLQQGLTSAEARQRLQQHGPNVLATRGEDPIWLLLWRQIRSLTVLVLIAAAIFSWVMGDTAESLAIAAVVLINSFIGLWLEWQARISMAALHRLDVPQARVVRDAQQQTIPSPDLTLGDVILIEAGDVLPADAELQEARQLQVNESALTGESLPVAKQPGAAGTAGQPADTPTRHLYKGTAVVNGNGRAIITGIGMNTELGRIAQLVQTAGRSATPLEIKINHLARQLILLTLGMALLYLLIGLLQGREVVVMIKMAIVLAIAAIPEGLSIVATLALAHGMLRLARQHVIVKQLAAVETLGSTSVIFTDKTGTLTHNQIAVNTIWLPTGRAEISLAEDQPLTVGSGEEALLTSPQFKELLRVAISCNNAPYEPGKRPNPNVGDPVEIALNKLVYSSYLPEMSACPRLDEKAFTSETRLMATLHQQPDGRFYVAVKGAAEEVLAQCPYRWDAAGRQPLPETEKQEWVAHAELLAQAGLRTLGFASSVLSTHPGPDFVRELAWVGLIGFLDPPRLEVLPALQACREAGIRVIMVTGDHPATARTVAAKVGLVTNQEPLVMSGPALKPIDQLTSTEKNELYTCAIFARVSPAQKLDLISLYQQRGDIVGMTGDGVNDAPALRKADIGIAMGKRGTQVASEAADMVLQDDAFASIVAAIGQGRVIFANIRTFILYLTSCNLSEILLVTGVGLLHRSVPLLPLQILFLNMITDVFPALALAVGTGHPHLMRQAPRPPQLPLLTRPDWITGLLYAAALMLGPVVVYFYSWEVLRLSPAICNNILFYGMALGQLLHVFNFSADHRNFFRSEITRNRYIWMALGICFALFLASYYIITLRQLLGIQPFTPMIVGLIAAAGILPVLLVQLAYRVLALTPSSKPKTIASV
ncbi:cation-transporting P-type ATPase [Hymenobacter sp. BT730]|uniref:cation-translocating P-type ATPase n=1 Tax=Hymenobacter sp. BT730 TaxID=3063332 RepID=UPI0026DED898|nr:cation-transporting P-type ATPase [Hymenobacter sp. BT730]